MKDLFGHEVSEVPETAPRVVTPRPDRAHAAPPGSGPAGETCRTCQHYTILDGYAKTYRKCGLRRAWWTNGAATDIRAKDAACAKWEPEQLEKDDG